LRLKTARFSLRRSKISTQKAGMPLLRISMFC